MDLLVLKLSQLIADQMTIIDKAKRVMPKLSLLAPGEGCQRTMVSSLHGEAIVGHAACMPWTSLVGTMHVMLAHAGIQGQFTVFQPSEADE